MKQGAQVSCLGVERTPVARPSHQSKVFEEEGGERGRGDLLWQFGRGRISFLQKGSPSLSQLLPRSQGVCLVEFLFPAFPVGKKKSLNNTFRLFVVERALVKR